MARSRAPAAGLATPQRYALSDAGNAERFASLFEAMCRFEHGRGRWLVWDKTRWAEDRTRQVMAFAIRTARSVVTIDAEMPGVSDEERRAIIRHGLDTERARRLEDMLRLASTKPEIAVRSEQLDADPLLLNVANGTVELRTGDLRQARRADLVTSLAPFAYEPGAACPTWEAFLCRVTGGSTTLQAFLRRAVGYSITGEVGEHCLFFLHGNGANGKSTFLETILSVLGDYAKAGAPGLLTMKRSERHLTELADLRGARLVTCSESGLDQALDEPRVKYLTGGDTMSARFMNQDLFTWRPTHKLWIATNHKPRVRGGDDGIWRRLKLIPFEQTIAEHERDPRLKEKLLAEAPGILSWAVQGCLEWQRNGLGVPEEVRDATNSYRAAEDRVGPFLDEVCIGAPTATVPASQLHEAYRAWAEAAGDRPMSQQALAEALESRGFERKRTKAARMWVGIGLKAATGDGVTDQRPVLTNLPMRARGERVS